MTGDKLDRIEAECRLHLSTETGPLDGFADDVLALVNIARAAQNVTEHHFDTCDLVLGESPAYPCNCGIDALRLALAALDKDTQ